MNGPVDEQKYSCARRRDGRAYRLAIGRVLAALVVVVVAASIGASPSARAAPPEMVLVLDRTDTAWDLGTGAQFLVDPGGQWTLADVQARDDWQAVGMPRRTLGLQPGVLWLRATVRNELPASSSSSPGFRVEFSHPRPIHLTAYVPDGDVVREKAAGLDVPAGEREELSRSVVVGFNLARGSEQTLYFRLATRPLGFSAVVTSERASARDEAWQQALLGVYYGIAVGLAVYNLFLLFALRDAAYAWYVVFVLTTVIFFLSRNGYYYQWGWTANHGTGGTPVVALQVLGIANFARTLLGTKEALPRLDRALRVLVSSIVAIGIVALLAPAKFHETLLAPLGAIVLVMVLSMGVMRQRQGSAIATYFLVAWAFFLLGAMLYIGKSTGGIPHTVFTEHSMQVGSALEMVLLSLALAHRVRGLEAAARERSHQLELQRLEHARAVDAMRAETAVRLIDAQDEHSRRIARDLHDSVQHRFLQIEQAASSLVVRDDGEEPQEIASLAREGIAETREIAHGLYPQRLHDVGLQGALTSAAAGLARTGVVVNTRLDDALMEGLSPPVQLVVLRIAEEALQNVQRHAAARHVDVTLAASGTSLLLWVDDDGRGVSPDRRIGLGTQTMRDRAAQLGGTVDVLPRAGGGTRVALTVPRA